MATVTYPIAPTLEARNGTLLQTVQVSDGIAYLVDPGEAPLASGLFESYASLHFDAVAEACTDNDKDLSDTGAWVDGFYMAAYGGITCNAVGGGVDQAEVARVFTLGESTAVEAGLMRVRFSDAVASGFAAVEDLTPAGGAVKPMVGAAILDGWMSRNYVGQSILHVPVVIADLMLDGNTISLVGNQLRTKTGAKVVAGVGYDYPNLDPAGAEADADTRWIYATGGIIVRRSELVNQKAFNQSNNEVTVLAERGYVLAVDGPVAAIEVQVSA